MKSVYLQKDKSIFKLDKLPADKFAEALGLPGTPKIKFLQKEAAQKKKNAPRIVETVDAADGDSSSAEDDDDHSEGDRISLKVSFFVRHSVTKW